MVDPELQSPNAKPQHTVAIIGGGPAGLMAAEVAARGGASVMVFDRMPSVGRKLLLAGRGGFNLTHSEDLVRFLGRYGAAEPRLHRAIRDFPPADLIAWCEGLGQPTFVGSSGRVFPKAMKASPLLRAWLERLRDQGVTFKLRHHWRGWDDAGRLLLDAPDGTVTVEAGATVLALGGASWPRLGSDGGWASVLEAAHIRVAALEPANCGFIASWSDHFSNRFAGQPLKRIELSFGETKARGEAIITRAGVEGGAVYALSRELRKAVAASGEAIVHIDLRPDMADAELEARLGVSRGKQSLSTFLRKAARLPPAAIGLLHEAAGPSATRVSALRPTELSNLIKAVPVRIIGVAPIARAISTAGGVQFEEIDDQLMLRRRPGTFVAGEMLDWEAPTGGYLLQAAFATGAAAARGALDWFAHKNDG